MALPDPINTGTAPNNGTGDPLRTAFQKSNARDEYLDQNKADIGDLQYYILLSEKGQPQGVATLDSNGQLPASQLPNLAITDVIVATENTISGFAANSGNYTFQQGDVIIIDDGSGNLTHYIYKGGTKTDVNEYSEISASEILISQVQGLQAELDNRYTKTEADNKFETPQGAQDKANAAEQAAIDEDDHINRVIKINSVEKLTKEQIATELGSLTLSGYESVLVDVDNFFGKYSLKDETVADIRIKTGDGQPYTIDWGDGTIEQVNSDVTKEHTYASAYTGEVKVYGNYTIRELTHSKGNWDYDIGNLPSGLTYYNNQGQNTTTGDIGNLPSGLSFYNNQGQNTTTGDIGNLPSGLTFYNNQGQNTTTGDISNLPSGLTYYRNIGNNTTTGDIGNLPSGLTYYDNRGLNTTTGDISNLPSGLTYYRNYGQNTATGDIGTLPSGLTYYRNYGLNTTTGDIGTLPSGLTYYLNYGLNTTTGDIGTLPSGLTYFNNVGQNTEYAYTGKIWSEGQRLIYSIPVSGGISSSEIDQLLIDLSEVSWETGKEIILTGAHQPRTAASDAAVSTLIGKGVSVTTNN